MKKKQLMGEVAILEKEVVAVCEELDAMRESRDRIINTNRQVEDALKAALEDTRAELRRFKIFGICMSVLAFLCYAALLVAPLICD